MSLNKKRKGETTCFLLYSQVFKEWETDSPTTSEKQIKMLICYKYRYMKKIELDLNILVNCPNFTITLTFILCLELDCFRTLCYFSIND